MILRRITEHVKAQNWFAVGLDFIIVVVGVFIGIQVANWNDSRAEKERAMIGVERVLQDVEAEIAGWHRQRVFATETIEQGRNALSFSAIEDGDVDRGWAAIRAFYNASHFNVFDRKDAAFQGLISDGTLQLITDEDLRTRMQEYYSQRAIRVLQDIPPYRRNIRGLVPIEEELYLYNDCTAISTDGRHEFGACPSPHSDASIVTLANSIIIDAALRRDLEYALSNANVMIDTLDLKVVEAREFANVLRQALGKTITPGDEP